MMEKFKPLAALLLFPLNSAAAPPENYEAPYRILQQANLTLDPGLAATAYASDGRLIFEYPGQPVETFQGLETIRSAYVRTFSQVDAGTRLELDFRFAAPGLSSAQHSGAFRLRGKAGGRDITVYGNFRVKLVKEAGAWRFAEDFGTPATAANFDKLPPVNIGSSI